MSQALVGAAVLPQPAAASGAACGSGRQRAAPSSLPPLPPPLWLTRHVNWQHPKLPREPPPDFRRRVVQHAHANDADRRILQDSAAATAVEWAATSPGAQGRTASQPCSSSGSAGGGSRRGAFGSSAPCLHVGGHKVQLGVSFWPLELAEWVLRERGSKQDEGAASQAKRQRDQPHA